MSAPPPHPADETPSGTGAKIDGDRQQELIDCEQALEQFRAAGDTAGEAATLNRIGRIYYDLGDPQQQRHCFEQAIPLYRAAGDTAGEASALNNLGMARAALGDAQGALLCYEQALPLRREAGDTCGEAITLHNIGGIYETRGDAKGALAYFDQALPIFLAVGDPQREAVTRLHIAMAAAALGELARAEEEMKIVVAIDEAANHPDLPNDRAALAEIRTLRRGKKWWQVWR